MRRDLRTLGIAVVYVLAYLAILPWWTFSSNLLSENSDAAFALGTVSTIAAIVYSLLLTRSLIFRAADAVTNDNPQ